MHKVNTPFGHIINYYRLFIDFWSCAIEIKVCVCKTSSVTEEIADFFFYYLLPTIDSL